MTTEEKALRIGLGVLSDVQTWDTDLRSAVRTASRSLGISEAAVCCAVTMAQDYLADLRVEVGSCRGSD